MNELEQLARDVYLRRVERLGTGYTTEGLVERAFDDAEKFFAELERRRESAPQELTVEGDDKQPKGRKRGGKTKATTKAQANENAGEPAGEGSAGGESAE